MHSTDHLPPYQVIELRRYDIRPGEREQFAQLFEAWFPGAFQQLGAMAIGEGFERDTSDRFTWLRGFPDMDTRATANAAFYYGPLWKEHRQTMNDMMLDSDNVLLLRPLNPAQGMRALPAVNTVRETAGATGVLVMQVIGLTTQINTALAAAANAAFATYEKDGVHVAGTLITLDMPNNFPQLPVRDDGSWLVWVGVLRDEQILETFFRPAAERVTRELRDQLPLRGEPELIVMNPAPASRLRWLSDFERSPTQDATA